ncbi:hypothetical protein M0657_006706 [Pyricularia oryzae]|uniref:Uncharacterized protein n=3 Tax=Pyricularia oryzae TaxID=318829 RepID=A0A4P7NIU9_PYROR|nr:hypothetical protein M9X92_006187 [Pyricularia oryzae]KAI7920255.1 hypothetical protein M0657_006706 [Pyricularia oryzae]QBZ61939.1 hypothetical protein PoMZ_08900 [Pyricularia oryzae]
MALDPALRATRRKLDGEKEIKAQPAPPPPRIPIIVVLAGDTDVEVKASLYGTRSLEALSRN